MYLLDTSVMFEILRASSTGAAALVEIGDTPIALSSLSRYELLATRTGNRFKEMKLLLRNIPILPYDSEVADVSAEMMSKLRDKGKMISYHDVNIAGTCIHNNLILVTLDKHFLNVPGLVVKKLDFED